MNSYKINISILIATYNSANVLRIALDSVLQQTYPYWECIIVDGASNDDTIQILETYRRRDHRFRYISEKDHGIYDAYNKGWQIAQGEWIYYLGSDDRLTKNGLADLMAVPHDGVDVISGNCYIEMIDGTIKSSISTSWIGCHQCKLVRRSAMQRFSGFDQQYPILADLDLMIRMQKANVKLAYVDTYIAYFAMTGSSQALQGLLARHRERYRLLKNNNIPHACYLSLKATLRKFLSIYYRKFKTILTYRH